MMNIATLAIPALWFLAAAAGAFAIAKALEGRGGSGLAKRLGQYTVRQDAPADGTLAGRESEFRLLRQQKYSNWGLLDQMISQRSWAEREAVELTRADVPLRVGEYMLLRWVLAGGLALAGLALTGNALLAIPGVLVGYILPRLWVKRCQKARQQKFDDQLVEGIGLLASTLKSGYSFLQGMEAVAREMPAPMSTEFDRLIKEIAVGARADEALLRLIERVRSDDLELVVTAIMIQRTVGGELAGILETISRTIRERQRIKRDVSTLTAQQRWSGYIIGAMPILLMVAIGFLNRPYVDDLLFSLHGRIMLCVAAVMEAIGFVMIRRIIAIEV